MTDLATVRNQIQETRIKIAQLEAERNSLSERIETYDRELAKFGIEGDIKTQLKSLQEKRDDLVQEISVLDSRLAQGLEVSTEEIANTGTGPLDDLIKDLE